MPKVTVLMSVYNDSKYLKESIDSILNQSFIDFEFLIFNDGSTDNSAKILDEYAARDGRIKIFHQNNIGLTKTLNKGISIAKGIYIARMDSDDISLADRFKKEAEFLDKYPEIAVVACFTKVIDENGRETGEHRPGASHEAIKKLSFFSGQLCHPAVMFRKTIIQQLGGYDEKFVYAQDCDLWFRVMKKNQVANIPEFLFLWRETSGGIGSCRHREQQICARRAKIRAMRAGLYPWYYFLFLLWPKIRNLIPSSWRNWAKKAIR